MILLKHFKFLNLSESNNLCVSTNNMFCNRTILNRTVSLFNQKFNEQSFVAYIVGKPQCCPWRIHGIIVRIRITRLRRLLEMGTDVATLWLHWSPEICYYISVKEYSVILTTSFLWQKIRRISRKHT